MKKQKGFTLIELMAALLVIGAIFTLAYPAWNFFVEMPRRTEAINFATAAINKQKLYFTDSGSSRYAEDFATLRLNLPPGWTCSGSVCQSDHWKVSMEQVGSTVIPLPALSVEASFAGDAVVSAPLAPLSIPAPPFFVIRGERINSSRPVPGFWADGLGNSEGLIIKPR